MSRSLFTSARILHVCSIALVLCGLGWFATRMSVSRAQEPGSPISPRLVRRPKFIDNTPLPSLTEAPQEVSVATNPIPNARDGHTATLLPVGRVLVVGGRNGSGVALSSVQIYNPATGVWAPAIDLVTP